jgi:hypothetical protein
MSKPAPQRVPDPMDGVVNRLLAQLPGLQGEPDLRRTSAPRTPTFPITHPAPRSTVTPEGQVLGSWLRLLLALGFGITMAAWPYQRACGFPLMGYISALSLVIWTGGWAASSAWRQRTALVHVLSLLVVLYGLMLTSAEVLPRIGYAASHAAWSCSNQ